MAVTLSFIETYTYPERRDGITIPVAVIANGLIIPTYAKVDSGSDFCIFSHEIGLALGLDVEAGIPIKMGSLTGTLDTFGHEVTLQTGNVAIHNVVYFAKYPGLPRNLLGRNGWLRHLRVAIIDYNNAIHWSPYDT